MADQPSVILPQERGMDACVVPVCMSAAKAVTACDFMEPSIAENRRRHEGLGNVDFLVADVTELQQVRQGGCVHPRPQEHDSVAVAVRHAGCRARMQGADGSWQEISSLAAVVLP